MLSSKQNDLLDLTILIPALNEEKRIGATLDEVAAFLKKDPLMKTLNVEMMVVSADARDNTHAIVQSKASKFRNFVFLQPGPRFGKGRDVQYGMLRARGKAVIFMDADLATPLKHLPQFYQAFTQGSEVIVGTRNLFKHHPNYLRRLISNTGNMLFRIAGGVWIEDSQCGFKMFSHDAAQVCFGKLTILGWGFDMEVLAIAKVNGYKIKRYRINDWKSMPYSTFVDGLIKNSFNMLRELAHIFAHRVTGKYRR